MEIQSFNGLRITRDQAYYHIQIFLHCDFSTLQLLPQLVIVGIRYRQELQSPGLEIRDLKHLQM